MTARLAITTALLASVWLSSPGTAQQQRQSFRGYNHRMEALLIELDRNNDGRLDRRELKNHPALMRRLRRQGGAPSLRLDQMGHRDSAPSGERLSRRFRQADRNGDQQLSVSEARDLPGISRRFNRVDRNGDQRISLDELWSYQRGLGPSRRLP